MTMTRPTHVLVPTDFSEESLAAKDYATMIADAFGATLHVLHVIPDPLTMGWASDAAHLPQLLEQTERTVREQLDRQLTPEQHKHLKAQVEARTGPPVATIVDYAERHGIDLIVMGTRGRGALERIWVGSVTQGVLQRARCPVVAISQPRK
jgi:nucleotide-binding universal stress UspA family protein